MTPNPAHKHDPGGRSKPRWPAESTVSAVFSDCGRYRYRLTESWDRSKSAVAFLMMNPSVASEEFSDPTLRKTGTYARAWGFGAQIIVNVHAYRATDSRKLLETPDPVGPENDSHIWVAAREAQCVVLAYGQPPRPLRPRAAGLVIRLMTAGFSLRYLNLSKDGTPCHPLYLPGDLKPKPWTKKEG